MRRSLFLNFRRLFSAILFRKMVRYFPNPFEDYKDKTITKVAINKNEIVSQINDHVATIVKRSQPSHKAVDGGLYVGTTGIAYMFWRLSKNNLLSENKTYYLEKAAEYLQPALDVSTGDKTSFLLGDAGTYALATVIFKDLGKNQSTETLSMYQNLYSHYLNPKFLKCGGDEFFVGRTGYLVGALWLTRELHTKVFPNPELYAICDMIVNSGKEYAKAHNTTPPLMYHYYNTEYLGAAHGLTFKLQVLITVPGYLEYNPNAAKDIKQTINFMASLQTEEGNWPCCLEEVGLSDHKLVHWCHGAPGTIYLMAKAFLVFKEQKFLEACIRAGELVWRKGLLLKGPGICHGVAGNGYVFLLLYRLTDDEKHLYRAKQFADFMNTDEFLKDARLPDNPQSLYEGMAGTVCFLSDLLIPAKSEFPFEDVFTTY